MKSPAVAAISHAFPRLRLPRKTSADAPPVRLSPARSAKKRNPYRIAFFQVAGWASRRIGLRCACPVGFLRCKNPVRLSPFRATKNATPIGLRFFSSGGMGFASNWTALRLPCRVFALQKSRSPLTFPRHKKRNPIGLRFFQVAGWTRLELATSCVTGRVILNNYQFIRKLCWKIVGCSSSKYILFYLSVNLANYLLIASKKSIFYFI